MSDAILVPSQIVHRMVQRNEKGSEYQCSDHERHAIPDVTYVHEVIRNVDENCYLLVFRRKSDGKYFGTPIDYSDYCSPKMKQNTPGQVSCYEMEIRTKKSDAKQYVFAL